MGDVIDSTHMPINKGNAHGTQRERTNGVNFQHSRLLWCRLSGRSTSLIKNNKLPWLDIAGVVGED